MTHKLMRRRRAPRAASKSFAGLETLEGRRLMCAVGDGKRFARPVARDSFETLETRRLLSGNGFVQGTVLNSAGNTPIAGVTLTLHQGTTIAGPVVATAGTDVNGYYQISGLAPGAYTLVETPPAGFQASSLQDVSQLYKTSNLTANSVTVNVSDGVAPALPWLLTTTGSNGEVMVLAVNNPHVSSQTITDAPGQLFATINEQDVPYTTPNLSLYCVDLNRTLLPPPYGADANVPYELQPLASALAVKSGTSAANAGRMAYLYNHFGLAALPLSQSAGLNLALWELDYDSNPVDVSSGDFHVAAGSDPAAVAAANNYLALSVGKNELAGYLNGLATSGRPEGSQGLLATELLNFKNTPIAPAALGDFVWNDQDRDGVQDAGEPGIPGVTVNLYDCANNALMGTTTTDANGLYHFTDLQPGSYHVAFTAPGGFLFSPQFQGGDTATDSNANAAGVTPCVTLVSGETNNTIDAGLYLSQPGINIVKRTNGTDNDNPTGPVVPVGSTVTWTYVVTNTGNVPLAGVTVRDDNGTPANTADDFNPTFVGGDANGNGLLDTTETWTYTAGGTAVAGQYLNFATVSGHDSFGTNVTDDNPDHYFGGQPAIDLVKLTNGTDNNSPTGPIVPVGSTVTWSYIVHNTGNVTLFNVVVVDDNGTPGNTADDFNVGTIATLAIGGSVTLTATGTAKAGQYENYATATGHDSIGETVTDTDLDHYFGSAATPNLTVQKVADKATVTAGSQIGYTVTIVNQGPGTASNVTLNDPLPAGAGGDIDWTIDAISGAWSPTITGAKGSEVLTATVASMPPGTFSVHIFSATNSADALNGTPATGFDSTGTAAAGIINLGMLFPASNANNYGVLGLQNTAINNSNVTIHGNAGISQGGSLVNMAPSTITGNVYAYASGQYSGPGVLGGSVIVDPTRLTQNDANALQASTVAKGLTADFALGTINSSTTVSATAASRADGVNVLNITGDIKNSLILSGTASDVFVVNVSGTVTLGGSLVLGLAGGLTANHVLYNFTGASGTISSHVGNVFYGTLLAPKYSMSLDGAFIGEVIAGGSQIKLLSGAKVNAGSILTNTATVSADNVSPFNATSLITLQPTSLF